MNLFDLPGPEFLRVYLMLLLVALLLGWVLRMLARAIWSKDLRHLDSVLRPEELAFVRGGANASVQATLAKAVRDGHVVVDPVQGVTCVKPFEGNPSALELGFEDLPEGTRVSQLTRELAEPLEQIEDKLSGAGYILTRGQQKLLPWFSSLPLWALMVIGAMKVGVGLDRGRPVVILIVLLVVTLIAERLLHRTFATRTGAAKRMITRRREEEQALKTAAVTENSNLSGADVALGAALFGNAVLWGDEMNPLLELETARQRSAMASGAFTCGSGGGDDDGGSFFSSCGSSRGASCGGGSGCGGGCGGCGS